MKIVTHPMHGMWLHWLVGIEVTVESFVSSQTTGVTHDGQFLCLLQWVWGWDVKAGAEELQKNDQNTEQ